MEMEAIQDLQGELVEKAGEALSGVEKFAKEKPHAAVGIALGLGWILGNGLPPRVIFAVASFAAKSFVSRMGAGMAQGLAGEQPTGAARGGHRAERAPRNEPHRGASMDK